MYCTYALPSRYYLNLVHVCVVSMTSPAVGYTLTVRMAGSLPQKRCAHLKCRRRKSQWAGEPKQPALWPARHRPLLHLARNAPSLRVTLYAFGWQKRVPRLRTRWPATVFSTSPMALLTASSHRPLCCAGRAAPLAGRCLLSRTAVVDRVIA